MVKQYPHTLSWSEPATPATRDERGFLVPGTPGATIESVSRYENYQKGGYKQFVNANGETVEARGVIYVKKGQTIPESGENVLVVSPEFGEMFQGTIEMVYPGQLNSTLVV